MVLHFVSPHSTDSARIGDRGCLRQASSRHAPVLRLATAITELLSFFLPGQVTRSALLLCVHARGGHGIRGYKSGEERCFVEPFSFPVAP